MNTAIKYTRINVTIPNDILEDLKRCDNMSRYISEAVKERMDREKREKALREILDAKPTFTDIPDGASFVRNVRSEDTKRDERLGLV